MPIYEYTCRSCHHEFEEIQKFSDPPVKVCPRCHKKRVIKKVSLSAFTLKGEGWYKDGYARPSEKPKPADTKTDQTKSSTASTKSTDTKTDTKPDSKTKPSTKTAKETTSR
ncbi:MAG: zinc ribbon domain-containing protein [Deltaproteobacteria bacterium]|nr:zinc ribbon domain-containing protein [Deltaproteobacteria bacterium]